MPSVFAEAPTLQGKQAEESKQSAKGSDRSIQNMGSQGGLDDYISAWGLANSITMQMALRAAIELDVLNIIAKSGPGAHLTAKEIVSQIPTLNPNAVGNLERILRMLAVHSLLSTSLKPCPNDEREIVQEIRAYGLTKETRCLVPNKDGFSLAPMVMLGSDMLNVMSLGMIKDAVLEPRCLPFHKAHGVTMYEYMSTTNPEQRLLFDVAMGISCTLFFDDVFKVYRGFQEVEELMDVGGGIGSWLAKTVSIHPHIRGINFDLPSVIVQAPVHQGVKHVSGDMFESIPNAQSIMLKWILHNWDDDQCKKLLRNCWEALPETGKVIVVELVIPEVLGNTAEISNLATLDIYMMINFGGRERSTTEFDNLAKAVGFVETKVFPISNGCCVIEFLKSNTLDNKKI